MTGKIYRALDQYFRIHESDTRDEIIELSRFLANRITAKAVKLHGESCGILDTKDLIGYLRIESETEIQNIFKNTDIFS